MAGRAGTDVIPPQPPECLEPSVDDSKGLGDDPNKPTK